MICPECSSEGIYVVDTMPGTDNNVYRRRKCLDCNTKFHTVEIVIPDGSPYKLGYLGAYQRKAKNRFGKKEVEDK